jgi:hypothetical protein
MSYSQPAFFLLQFIRTEQHKKRMRARVTVKAEGEEAGSACPRAHAGLSCGRPRPRLALAQTTLEPRPSAAVVARDPRRVGGPAVLTLGLARSWVAPVQLLPAAGREGRKPARSPLGG